MHAASDSESGPHVGFAAEEVDAMAALKVLFADDHIPPEDASDSQIEHDRKRFPLLSAPTTQQGVNPWVAMRRALKAIREMPDYSVEYARTLRQALEMVRQTHFDIAIVDIGWYDDPEVDKPHKPQAGWGICNAIDAANK